MTRVWSANGINIISNDADYCTRQVDEGQKGPDDKSNHNNPFTGRSTYLVQVVEAQRSSLQHQPITTAKVAYVRGGGRMSVFGTALIWVSQKCNMEEILRIPYFHISGHSQLVKTGSRVPRSSTSETPPTPSVTPVCRLFLLVWISRVAFT